MDGAACRNRTDDLFITMVISRSNVLSILAFYLSVAVRRRSARCVWIRARCHPVCHPRTPHLTFLAGRSERLSADDQGELRHRQQRARADGSWRHLAAPRSQSR